MDPGLLVIHGMDFRPAFLTAAATLAWLAAAWLAARACDLFLRRAARASGRPAPYPRLLHDLLRAGLFGAAAIGVLLYVLGQEATGLIATSSVLIAVVGFALRNIIGDVFSGIALGIDHPCRIGDWIEVVGVGGGQVVEINWRATRVVTRDGISVVLPNGLLAGQRLVNYSAPDHGFRVVLQVALEPAVPVDRAKRVLLAGALDAARAYPALRPDVLVKDYGESGVLYLVRFWVPDYGQENACRDAVASAVLRVLASAGIPIAYPKQDLVVARARPGASQRRPDRAALLGRVDLFQVFDEAERTRLAESMAERCFERGEVVFREGDAGCSLFILAEGALDVTVRHREAGERSIDRLVPGNVFGEMSLLTGQPRSATLAAASDAVAYEIDAADLHPVLRSRPELASALAGLMADRQRRNAERRRAFDEDARAPAPPTRDDLLTRIRSLFGIS
jgi:small-conductance mechanosensitive channel/CRP-like cAMP-binding protein